MSLAEEGKGRTKVKKEVSKVGSWSLRAAASAKPPSRINQYQVRSAADDLKGHVRQTTFSP
jgi:hypothetical protein